MLKQEDSSELTLAFVIMPIIANKDKMYSNNDDDDDDDDGGGGGGAGGGGRGGGGVRENNWVYVNIQFVDNLSEHQKYIKLF